MTENHIQLEAAALARVKDTWVALVEASSAEPGAPYDPTAPVTITLEQLLVCATVLGALLCGATPADVGAVRTSRLTFDHLPR